MSRPFFSPMQVVLKGEMKMGKYRPQTTNSGTYAFMVGLSNIADKNHEVAKKKGEEQRRKEKEEYDRRIEARIASGEVFFQGGGLDLPDDDEEINVGF